MLLDMGQKTTGGYTINIQSVKEYSDHVMAAFEFIGPGSDCAATQVLTNPFVFATVDTQKEIRFTLTTVEYCD